MTEGRRKPQKGEIYICMLNRDRVEVGCFTDGSAERSAYVVGASEQEQQVLREQEGVLVGEQGIVKNTALFRVDIFPETSQPIATRCEYT